MAGQTGPIHVSRAIAMVMAALFALACYNVVEILISTFTTFRRRHGLYFWSILVCSFGILLHAISGFLRYFALAPNFLMSVLICIGWYAMVTGQSVVLYSRLHLVSTHCEYFRYVLWMIIINACIFHIPTTILFLGSNHGVDSFVTPFNIYERIQLTGFSIQETIISALYIWETVTGLRPILLLKGLQGRRVILNLVLVNSIAILLDASLLALEYSDHFDIQTSYKPLVYSIKLKMEFTVLNSLVAVINSSPTTIEEIQGSRYDNLNIQPRWSGDHSTPGSINVATETFGQCDRRKGCSTNVPCSPDSRTSDYPMLSVKSGVS
ncbi:uncharacterized protein N7484_001336 [Penicillium longicatenatum]|uniref:uncharacterized protein n=1 Tax=Penicillium longicatenatum TaxID=1561947 RepID=UPI002548B10C|nr:uncharacterized protein N7484_001336 [Penicillium longicatenatum]KAJ5657687.1 hypothetical protein N7484_001336 [Penicillium longicatenatum]